MEVVIVVIVCFSLSFFCARLALMIKAKGPLYVLRGVTVQQILKSINKKIVH